MNGGVGVAISFRSPRGDANSKKMSLSGLARAADSTAQLCLSDANMAHIDIVDKAV